MRFIYIIFRMLYIMLKIGIFEWLKKKILKPPTKFEYMYYAQNRETNKNIQYCSLKYIYRCLMN